MTNVARLCIAAVLAATGADARPIAAQDTLEYSLHGITIRDPARRMEASRSADVLAWARQQDSVTRAWLGRVSGADELRQRVRELATVTSFSVPQYGAAGLFYLELDGETDERRIRVRDRAGVESVLVLPHGTGRLANFAPAPRGPFMLHELHDEASGAVRLILTRQHGDTASLVASHDGMRTSQAPWLPDGAAFVAARGDTVFRLDTAGTRTVLL
ncbi:MAG TPA: hypothetical protein VK928_03530, partial [Longimicrobiales bacterium]|nr:hypothetical protein [Longimicrobiales bacterium]